MVQLVLGHERRGRDPTTRPTPSRSRPGSPTRTAARRSARLPSATGPPSRPITRGETGYERAVREALASERNAEKSAS